MQGFGEDVLFLSFVVGWCSEYRSRCAKGVGTSLLQRSAGLQVVKGFDQQHEQAFCQGPPGFSSRVLPHPAWAAGLPPLFAPPSQEQPDQASPGHSVQASQTQRSGSVSRRKVGLYQPPRRRTPARRSWTREEDGWSSDSCESFSEDSRAGTVQEDLSESNHSSQGSQQTSSSALEALLAVADTCTNTGCLSPEEALKAARQRYELARTRGPGALSAEQDDSPRRAGEMSGTPRASPRASRPGAFGGVSKLTAQQRRARHRCNNPWSISETQALLEGIEHCGVGKWADIQRLRLPAIIKRSPVDLKDKWRNLSRLAQDPNTGRANNTVPRHFLLHVRRILGLPC
ncbi:hypothetical protein WJX84_001525 [Apatococcus fuscideae]|uniref:Uncharacterized protein n=1 Tax=Apatococcus fuscideae TaxID=2026836 RepID=A0AAW1SGJ7_9CHLO